MPTSISRRWVERVWNSILSDGRQEDNILRIESNGVKTSFASEPDLPEFYALYAKTIRRAGAPLIPIHPSRTWTGIYPKYFQHLAHDRKRSPGRR
jgi:hypothetical protein